MAMPTSDPPYVQITVEPNWESLTALATPGPLPFWWLAAQAALQNENEAELSRLCRDPDAPEEFLLKLSEEEKCVHDLGHREGPHSLLWRLAEKWRYPEAIITLAKHYFIDENTAPREFSAFLQRFMDQDWMLESLAHQVSPADEKERIWCEAIRQSANCERLSQIHESTKQAMRARLESDATVLERLFLEKDYRIWRALAANPHTPRDILLQLQNTRHVNCAHEIRQLATTNLARHTS